MIHYTLHKQIDRQRWDDCIRNAPSGNIYGYSWYLDCICPGWDALVNDDYSTVMAVTRRKKYLVEYIFPPYLAQQLGVYSQHEITKDVCFAFLSAIPQNFRFIEMNLSISINRKF